MKSYWSAFVIPLAGGALAGALLAGGGAARACTCFSDASWRLSKLEQQPDAPPDEDALWPAQAYLYPEGLSLWQPGTELSVQYGGAVAP
jgi:hypothetical protein